MKNRLEVSLNFLFILSMAACQPLATATAVNSPDRQPVPLTQTFEPEPPAPMANFQVLQDYREAFEIPPLEVFARQSITGNADEYSGIYAPGKFAISIVPPPDESNAYSVDKQFITRHPNDKNVLYFSAHRSDTGSGVQLLELANGDIIQLIRGDGTWMDIKILNLTTLRADDHNDTDTDFWLEDLFLPYESVDNMFLTSSVVYPRSVTFVTCGKQLDPVSGKSDPSNRYRTFIQAVENVAP